MQQRFSCMMDDETYAALEYLAEEDSISMAGALRRLVRKEMTALGRPAAPAPRSKNWKRRGQSHPNEEG